MTIMRPGPEDVPRLDLGKKVSVAQDLMIEELSLPNNRGSLLFQQRQKRMQRFTFEHPSGYRELPGPGASGSQRTEKGDLEGTANEWKPGEDAEGQQSYHSELHVAASPQGGPPEVPKKTEKVLQMSKVLNPDALAPGKCRLHPKADTVVISVMWGWRQRAAACRGDLPKTLPQSFYMYTCITDICYIYVILAMGRQGCSQPPLPCSARCPSPAVTAAAHAVSPPAQGTRAPSKKSPRRSSMSPPSPRATDPHGRSSSVTRTRLCMARTSHP
ncbi:myozenin-3 isoform 3-T5 [Morphnus guianensis]